MPFRWAQAAEATPTISFSRKAIYLRLALDVFIKRVPSCEHEEYMDESRPAQRCLQALLEAGADPATMGTYPRDPLPYLPCQTEWSSMYQLLQTHCICFKPLSRGVYIHREDITSRSVVAYMERLFANAIGRFENKITRWVQLVETQVGNKNIQWLK